MPPERFSLSNAGIGVSHSRERGERTLANQGGIGGESDECSLAHVEYAVVGSSPKFCGFQGAPQDGWASPFTPRASNSFRTLLSAAVSGKRRLLSASSLLQPSQQIGEPVVDYPPSLPTRGDSLPLAHSVAVTAVSRHFCGREWSVKPGYGSASSVASLFACVPAPPLCAAGCGAYRVAGRALPLLFPYLHFT
jgi:hypothetical protein